MGSLKIGLALWSLGPTRNETEFKNVLETAREIGVQGVQLWCVDYSPSEPCFLDPDRCVGSDRRRVKEIVESYGLKITGFCAQLTGPMEPGMPWPGSALSDPRSLEKRIEKTMRALELASDMGSAIVTTHPGEIPSDISSKKYAVMLDSCKTLARHAEQVGAVFCIETGQETAEVLRRLLEDVGREGLKVNYDPANMLKYGVVEGVRTLAPWIVHTHAKDYNPVTKRATVGEGLVPWDDYISTLKSVNYSGWFAIEDETGIDVEESIKRGKAFLEKY
ncbi:MAG: sugar phosphate isomerase/epimerase [Candidatus Brockarchaeota archaeon]|nr:sugar phosphate isomerase/epimerase [Candidatus Brockarchaeota archaeon]